MRPWPLILLCLCLCNTSQLQAQNPDSILDGITHRLGLTDTVMMEPELSLQLDKQVYAVTDDIWFTAWLMNGITTAAPCHTLYLLLVNDMTARPVSVSRYVLEQGRASGSLPIPDSLEAGEYSLVAYTNTFLEGKGWAVRRSIQLLGGRKAPFRLQFMAQAAQKDSLRITGRVTRVVGGLATDATVNYTIYQAGCSIGRYNGRTNAFGECTVILSATPAVVPLEVRGTIRTKQESMPFKLPVRIEAAAITVLGQARSCYELHLPQTVVQDTLHIEVAAPAEDRRCWLLVYNHREILFSAYLSLPKKKGYLRLPTAGWNSRSVRVSLFDEQGSWHQQATGTIQPIPATTVSIRADSSRYQPRSPVTLHITLKDTLGNPVKGTFSLAVALAKTSRHQQNQFMAAEGAWPSPLSGRVTYAQKKLKKPATLFLAGTSSILVNTDAAGYFQLPPEALYGPAQQKLFLSVTAKDPIGYALILDTSVQRLHDTLAARYFSLPVVGQDTLTAEEKERIRSASGKLLEQVTVTARKDDSHFYGVRNPRGDCNDYVCHLGFLNCQVHPRQSEGTTQPVEGATYTVEGFGTTRSVVYHCAWKDTPPHIQQLPATWYPAPFNPYDGSPDAAPEILYRTTLYWSPTLSTNDQGEATVTFYTNDLTGKFTITVQGVHAAGVFNGVGEVVVGK